ncbi:DNA polymerase III subunit gamma/tau [Tengunoibacter tsumagoiensis]|uniref:DNA polymerase III subunit gamma/tau n=1 Tax=Tengunoibacter tsumagoiensis TaxID=2014871 RepID=A0A401ZZ05_9CHLR|nr:DNA polymerase III subunit gamma/tau [Tengunoibacter tsumagoiensis]GCE12063.1 hypothetical protein KTT_19220 [Tengunoibacter tsumagoiensis]
MASQSLYRKWRSQTFGDLVGQEPVIRTLKNALASGNLAHAYLFTGPRGTGKTSTARLLAKTINCPNATHGEPCNICEQCREITAGNSFNVIEIDAASNRGIDSIRDLREKVMMPPSTGKYKIYILDEAHMLTVEAFNALLKTLEEPPPHAIFVMATTDVHKMLPTVLSRCQRFDFKRITTRQIVEHLKFVAGEEQVSLEQGAAELIARAASGGMRDALSLLDQAIAYAGQSIALTQVQAMLGVADPRAIQKFITSVAELNSARGLHLINELAEAGADLRQVNTQTAEYWRAMMLSKAGANIAEILDNTQDEINEMSQLAQQFQLEELTECARVFAQNELVQKNQGTPQLGLELALLSCIEIHRRGSATTSVPTSVRPAPTQERRAVPPPQPAPVMAREPKLEPRPEAAPESSPAPRPEVAREPSPVPRPEATREPSPVPIKQEGKPVVVKDVEPILIEDEFVDDSVWDDQPLRDEDEPIFAPSVLESLPPPVQIRPGNEPPPVQIRPGNEPPQEPVTEPLDTGPGLSLDEVRERWEYVKRRVKTKKDGPKVAAFLNGYTIVEVQGKSDLAVVVIRAIADFHYNALQKNEYQEIINWALKVELNQECRVRILPPGSSGGMGGGAVIPPLPRDPQGNLSNSIYSLSGQASAYTEMATVRKQSVSERPASSISSAAPSPVRTTSSAQPQATLVQEVVSIKQEQTATPVATPASPLARTANVRENSSHGSTALAGSTSGSRQQTIEKKAKSDPIVKEVIRIFRAELKDIQPK